MTDDERAGYEKAYHLLNKGLESVCGDRDRLKHECRRLAAENDRLRAELAAERERCARAADHAAAVPPGDWDPYESDPAGEYRRRVAARIAAAIRKGNSP